jgi:FkbM family methyltransferase
MSIATLLGRHAPSLFAGLRMVKNRQFELTPPRVTYAPKNLHDFIKSRFGAAPGVYFEVGANDGLTQSNTAYLERYCGWSGILVEAIPHKYVECKRNRPRSMIFHAALVSDDYDLPYVPLRYSNLMSVIAHAADADVEAHLDVGHAFLKSEAALSGETFLAPAMTATDVILASGVERIDLFSLDVEGAEMDVLAGIDFVRVRPRAFIIEARNINRITSFLADKGYVHEQQLTHHDHLFVDGAV